MTVLGYAEVPSTSFIIARNWDRLGGRLSEIVNGLYLAERCGVPFRFVWPDEDLFPEVRDLLSILCPNFLRRHLIDPAVLRNIEETVVDLNGTISENDFLRLLNGADGVRAVRILNFMRVPKFTEDSVSSQLADFAKTSDSIWSAEVSAYGKALADEYKDLCVLHCRFGDLVTGQWRNWVDPSKYITALQIDELLKQNSNIGVPTHIVSDSREIFELFEGLGSPQNKSLDYLIQLNTGSRLIVKDLFILRSCKEVVAPEASAFSTIGARIGGKEPRKLTRPEADIWRVADQVKRTKALWSRMPSENRGAFISRDIDQLVNSLSGIYDLQTFGAVAKAALAADPKNVVSLNNLAVFYALVGDRINCESLIALAKEYSVSVEKVHHDPLFFTLTTEYVTQLIFFMQQTDRKGPTLGDSEYPQIKSDMLELEPYQLDKNWINESLMHITLELNKRDAEEPRIHPRLYAEVLNRLLVARFTAPIRPIMILNIVQTVLAELSSEAQKQERERGWASGIRRWSRKSTDTLSWVRARLNL